MTASGARRVVTELTAALGKWYDAHAAVRRLWASEQSGAVRVVVALEPTSDGDDALPAWLANSREWTGDLRSLTNRDVELQAIFLTAAEESPFDADAVLIAEFSWRDAWSS